MPQRPAPILGEVLFESLVCYEVIGVIPEARICTARTAGRIDA